MKNWLRIRISTKLSFAILTVVLSGILLYVTFKIGEINGFYNAENIIQSSPQIVETSIAVEEPTPLPITAIQEFTSIDPQYFETDAEALISIHTPADAEERRRQVIAYLWGTLELPTTLFPETIRENIQDHRYAHLYQHSLQTINHIVVSMDFEMKSHIYHFIPKHDNGRLVLFHQGHDGDFIQNIELIETLLNQGYSVAAFCMPLVGLNNQPTAFIPRFGHIKLVRHDHLKLLTPDHGSPIRYLLEPVIVFLNYIMGTHRPPTDIAMIGISGGGWTTTLIAALDDRVTLSIPIAGSYPLYIRSRRDWSDYESNDVELYRTCNYLELYVLASFGRKGRSQLQIINQFDSCCFAGVKWQTYYDAVRNRAESLGDGAWDLWMDDTHAEHKISAAAREQIMALLEKRR